MWTVIADPLVWSEDLARLDPPVRRRILQTFRTRLAVDPKAYGKPLREELSGWWKLRVGAYRVIYQIIEQRVEVLVLKVGLRRDFEVYREALKRLQRIQSRA